ncbi:MAG: ComEC/Rec2 family competence protein [Candidatus Nealsonbacteria bacterium]|nr:ComEC/Rec2 family competence protein [Candidatus Nealsonbacteria bacterium]
MSKSKIFFYLCVSFIFGVAIGQALNISQPVIPAVFILGIFLIFLLGVFLISIFYNNRKAVLIGLCIICIGTGIWRADYVIFKNKNNDFIKYGLLDKTTDLEATVISEPQSSEKSLRLVAGDIRINGKSIGGKIAVTTFKYPEFKFNDIIKISGKLEVPVILDNFDYQKYLEKDNIFATMSFPKVELIGHKKAGISIIYEGILSFKSKLRESIQKNFSPPQSSTLEGMILGDNNALSSDFKSKLNITGLRHIIAISGTHVVILSSILMSFFIAIGLWRGQAFYLSIFFIIIYVVLSGNPASGVRSLIMGVIFMYGQKIGRKSISARTIVIAGTLMLLINPLLLFYDVGFQLSFLACFGMIYLSPIFLNLFKLFLKEKFINLQSMVSTTLAAQAFTLPIMVYNFGNISFISIITNILALPVVYPLMVFGFISTFAGVFFDLVSWVFVLPAWFFLTYFIKIIEVFSLPQFLFQINNIHWLYLVLSYFALFGFIFFYNKKSPKGFLKEK